jgi:hypothetical protein
MELSRDRSLDSRGLLYPLMVIAAIAVIAFSILGIATIMGWMPDALANAQPGAAYKAGVGVTFECAECGVLESLRDIDQRHLGAAPEKVAALTY